MRFVVDCETYVVLARSPDAKAAAIRRAEAGEIEFLMTHLQWDEIACLEDRDVRMSISDIPRRNVPTHRVIREASRNALRGETRIASGTGAERLWRSEFLVSVAAQYDDVVLVTDNAEISKHAGANEVEVWPTSRLIWHLTRAAAPTPGRGTRDRSA